MRQIRFTPREVTYRTRFFDVYHSRADFGSFSKDYFVVHFGPRAGVIAVRGADVLLVRQYRYLINDLSWELPGGTIEPTESPEQGAARECLEETGVRCRGLRPLVTYYPGLDNVDNRTTIWYSEDIEVTRSFVGDEAEVREIVWLPLTRCIDMIMRQEILDAMSVAGLLAYNQMRDSARRA